MDKQFFVQKRKSLFEAIEDRSLVVLFAGVAPQKSADERYRFTPNKNFYYMTGIESQAAVLVMEKHGRRMQETLYIEKPDPDYEKWSGRRIRKDEAAESSGIEKIEYLCDFYKLFSRMFEDFEFGNLYLDLERLEWETAQTPAQAFAAEVLGKYSFLQIRNVHYPITELRLMKSAEEVEAIRCAIDITGEGIKSMMKNCSPGLKEYALEAYFDYTLKTAGVKETGFSSIVASGINGTILHYENNDCTVPEDALVLVDAGAKYRHYNADITRTFPASGKFTDRQKLVYNIVLKAQLEVIKAIKPGVPFRELNEIVKKVYTEDCKAIGLINDDAELSRYYFHGVSHYLGLDTHDVGSREMVLKSGMVLTVEPGLYIEEEAIGIRIEDDVLVTDKGCEVLSDHIPKTVEEIEAFMVK